jgi:hypothetical protein
MLHNLYTIYFKPDLVRISREHFFGLQRKYGNEVAQEWTSGKKITLSKPDYSQAMQDRHAARVKATRERIELRLKSLSLRAEKTNIEAKINQAPTDHRLLKEMHNVDNQIARDDIKLNCIEAEINQAPTDPRLLKDL